MTKNPTLHTILCLLSLFGAVGVCFSAVAQIHFPSGPFSVTDVSPERPYGSPADGANDPGGRILSLVIDPLNDSTLYAASELAGVWKSVDAAHTWFQASGGLRTGITRNERSLAVDARNPKRLLYVAQDDDGRVSQSLGGLWISLDAAASWQHVDLPCPSPDIQSVVFASSQPFVAARCNIFTSTDPVLANWQALQTPFLSQGAVLVGPGLGSQTLFACAGTLVYRSLSLGRGTSSEPNGWDPPIGLGPGNTCYNLAVAPLEEFQASTVLASHASATGSGREITVINFNDGSTQDLNFSGNSADSGSGKDLVFSALRPSAPPFESRPGFKYDVYAADGCAFYALFPLPLPTVPLWSKLQSGGANCDSGSSGIHADTWSMAFASTYDPLNGVCAAYAATDGGVFANFSSTQPLPVGACLSGWVRAQSGLHAMYSGTMAGLSQQQSKCPVPSRPCPALYLPTGDNDVWVTTDGGLSWNVLGANLGDAGQTFIDPALPNHELSARGGGRCQMSLAVTPGGDPPSNANLTGGHTNCISDADTSSPTSPPNQSGLSQVMTLPSESSPSEGVYFWIESKFRSGTCPDQPCTANDLIVRSVRQDAAPFWTDVESTAAHFGPGQVAAIAASGGVTNPTVYVVTASDVTYAIGSSVQAGQVYKATLVNGAVAKWTLASSGLNKAVSLFVNPYDPNELYANDFGDHTIKASGDGGKSWHPQSVLMDIASNHGEFRLDCGFPNAAFDHIARPGRNGGIFQATCALSGMAFDRQNPAIRVAATYPGGLAFSRDGGTHWIELDVTNNVPFGFAQLWNLIELPQSVFYDGQPNPQTDQPSIYMALLGNSVKRIDGPFGKLQSFGFLCGAPCAHLTTSPVSVPHVVAVVGRAEVPLIADSKGVFRGNFVFDSAKLPTVGFHFVIDGRSTPEFSHKLSAAELESGVATCGPPSLNVLLEPNVIFPPAGKEVSLVPMTATIKSESDCAATPAVRLVSIVSNQPDPAPNDIQGAAIGSDGRSFALQATSKKDGRPRVYTVVYQASDPFGNATEASAQVTVLLPAR